MKIHCIIMLIIVVNSLVVCAETHRVSSDIAQNVSKETEVLCNASVVSGIKNIDWIMLQ